VHATALVMNNGVSMTATLSGYHRQKNPQRAHSCSRKPPRGVRQRDTT
jgi:hypothetical protein